ncbi:MAG: deoxyribodipyrimidine photo-lyase [Acidobacteriota bacterium]|nr:deoxyribodipyrimidine photo-lyase [Acidobacteriota bacterium]
METEAALPESLTRLCTNPRIQVRRGGEVRRNARCVVYWMQRAQRIHENPALDVAIEAANILGLPVVVYFSVISNYPNANVRHYHFMQQGLCDVESDAAERGVGFILRRQPDNSLEAFLEEVEAALLIGDENPCREPERWRSVLSRRLKLPFWTVDSDVIVPSAVFGRSFHLLHHFRPHLNRELPQFLVPGANLKPQYAWKPWKALAHFSPNGDITEGFKSLDRKIRPVDTFTGGTHAALRRLDDFLCKGISAYTRERNLPERDGTSRLSPYLHFGHISPITIAFGVQRAVEAGRVTTEESTRFLDQVIGWRELSVLFVKYEPNYDTWECAEPWARKTLMEHAGDVRQRYEYDALERGETGDDLWNAAQRQMVDTGWMHNYMRMYWAKKILEWAPDPARAFEWAVTLNDRYELDGRDPNGYAGIAWSIVGRHDRPWFNRPVFGLIRPMSGASLAKKFDSELYKRTYLG